MGSRRIALGFLIVAAALSMGAQYRTTNFVVNAQDAQVAKQIGDAAEVYRRDKAIMWLGHEMPNWPQPCPLHVTVNMEGPSGATSFQFGQGRVMGMKMEIQGPLDRLLASVLPHEITHTVFAHQFRQPVPRWADEGGSVLSEDEMERERHDRLTRQILNRGQQIPLRRLFSLKEYPREVMCLYAQGYSMSDYLVKRSNHAAFLNFIGHGMQYGWDGAVQSFYGHQNVEDLEEAWLKHLKDTKSNPRTPPTQVASAQGAAQQRPSTQSTSQPIVRLTAPDFGGASQVRGADVQSTGRPMMRLTAPPAQPLDPVYRGSSPTPDQVGQRFASSQVPPLVAPQAAANATWTPAPGFAPQTQYLPATITLGAIQPEYAAPTTPLPRYASPVGFPR